MMRGLLVWLWACLSGLSLSAVADTANIVGGTGGRLHMAESAAIAMLDEEIDIRIHRRHIEFDIRYRFRNESRKPQRAIMGFPEKPGAFTRRLNNFAATADGVRVPVDYIVAPPGSAEGMHWHRYEVSFAAGQTREVLNRYWIYPTEYRGLYSFEYILRTGASWKGKIGKVKVRARLDKGLVAAGRRLQRLGIENEPTGWSVSGMGSVLEWRGDAIEPKEDLSLFYEVAGQPFAMSVDAASGEIGEFSADNAYDEDLNTAWAVPKPGAGEWIRLRFGEGPVILDSIGILPGRATDERFTACGRVKRVRLKFSDGSSQSILFEDIPTLQYVKLKPVKTSEITIVVDEIARGMDEPMCENASAFISEIRVLSN